MNNIPDILQSQREKIDARNRQQTKGVRGMNDGELAFQVNLLRPKSKIVATSTISRAMSKGLGSLHLLSQIISALQENKEAGIYISFDGQTYQKVEFNKENEE
jgi:hypothetical protein